MIDLHPVCDACGRELPRAEAMLAARGGPVVCRAGECQGLLAQRFSMSEEAFRAHFARQSGVIRARHAQEALRQARIEAVDTAEVEDNRRITEAVRSRVQDGDRLVSLALPRGRDEPAVPSPERRAKFRAHLETVIAEAESLSTAEAIPEERYKGASERNRKVTALLERQPLLRDLGDELCSLCRGGCCTTGEDHAYLTALTIRRLLDADATRTGADLLEAYLAHTPPESMEGACLLQTSSGCALPRALRSDVCNGYFCPSLVSLHQGWSEEDPRPVLAIQRDHHVWNRYRTTTTNPVRVVAIVDGEGVHDVSPAIYALPPLLPR